ncbi:hypothetical protein CUJ83_14670 [Methanocella sp. CWC-04]|uniref:Uncharacterized protein n=1 Tax=Methanooceanicella nereidis TaxID=2052831 RepID=A0AAP2RF95_9EURY|nr:hypothetical protein [Methanocella sp. CWC-04]MCD1296243.1 hypothetical protein [Methanocella sp. CWC-04]
METKYREGIKAGIIGGSILGSGIILRFLADVADSWYDFPTGIGSFKCCVFIFMIIAAVITGAIAVYMVSRSLASLNDAIKVSAVAGTLAGLIAAFVRILTSVLSPWVSGTTYYDAVESQFIYSLGYSIEGASWNIVCCGPIILAGCVLLAILGGAIYAIAVLKLK